MSFEEKDSDLQDYAFRGHGVDRGNHHGGNWNGRASHSSHLAVATTVTLQEPSVHLEDNVHSTPTRPVPVEASSTSSVQDQTPQSTSNTTGGSDKDESSEETSNGDEDSSKPGLSIHNKFRKEYQADPLSWSAELAATAASDAKQQCNGLVHTSSGQVLFFIGTHYVYS